MDMEMEILKVLEKNANRWFMIYELYYELFRIEINKQNECESYDRIWGIILALNSLFRKDKIEMTISAPQKEICFKIKNKF
jgi:hypothetical protein